MSELARLGNYAYLSGEALGAIPNGARIQKVAEEDGDTTPIGAWGTVLSSLDAREATERVRELLPAGAQNVTYFYFVEWDWRPGVPIGLGDWKIR